MVERINPSARAVRRWRAQIFVGATRGQRTVPLDFKVNFYMMSLDDPSRRELVEYRMWEDMRSPATPKMPGLEQVVSCSIPDGYMPPKHILLHWVLNSAMRNSSGAIGGFQGPLNIWAYYYTKKAFRPMASRKPCQTLCYIFLTKSSMSLSLSHGLIQRFTTCAIAGFL